MTLFSKDITVARTQADLEAAYIVVFHRKLQYLSVSHSWRYRHVARADCSAAVYHGHPAPHET